MVVEVTKRIKIPIESYYKKKKAYIRSILGNNTNIIKIHKNNIITGDNCYIIDVTYTSGVYGHLDPFKMYFIRKSDLSQTEPTIIKIESSNVKIETRNIQFEDLPEIIPIRIYPVPKNSYLKKIKSEINIHYYSKILYNPLTNITIDNNQKIITSEKVEITPIKTDLEKNSIIEEDKYLQQLIKDKEYKLYNYYDLKEKFKDGKLNGIIHISDKRTKIPFGVFHIEYPSKYITKETYDLLEDFLKVEYNNMIQNTPTEYTLLKYTHG